MLAKILWQLQQLNEFSCQPFSCSVDFPWHQIRLLGYQLWSVAYWVECCSN